MLYSNYAAVRCDYSTMTLTWNTNFFKLRKGLMHYTTPLRRGEHAVASEVSSNFNHEQSKFRHVHDR